MIKSLTERMKELKLREGEVAVGFLGQAGLLIKSYPADYYVIDPYLSDYCYDIIGLSFKRLTPAPLDAEDLAHLSLAAFLITHHHQDHLDVPTITALKQRDVPFYAPPQSIDILKEIGIEQERCHPLNKQQSDRAHLIGSATVRAVFADHGDLAPDAVGILFECHGKRIYHMGDTCLNVEEFRKIGHQYEIDLLLVPINGQYGNMNEAEAAEATVILAPKMAVPCHYWMLPGNSGGDPAAFVQLITEQAQPQMMATGEIIVL